MPGRFVLLVGTLIFLVIASVFGGVACGNDGYVKNVGGTISIMAEHPTIRLIAEHVHARVFRNHVDVECVFVLYNGGEATTVQTGFPDYSGGAVDPEYDRHFEYFKSYINGREVVATVTDADSRQTAAFTYWWTKEIEFDAEETVVIRNVYRGGIGEDVALNRWFSYLLYTGASWAGSIGIANIVVTLEDFGPEQLTKISPPESEVDGNEIRWTFVDYEPTRHDGRINLWWETTPETEIDSELHRLAALGDMESVTQLLKTKKDINDTREYGRTPLIDAIFFGAGPDIVQKLIELGADVNFKADGWGPPLKVALAAHERYKYAFTFDVVQILIDNGAVVTNDMTYYFDRTSGDLRNLLEVSYAKGRSN